MNVRTTLTLSLLVAASTVTAQASLTTFDAPLVIDFYTTVPGVNNGLFTALPEMGATEPMAGQLDLDAWDYREDGSMLNAVSTPATFPGTLPVGNGEIAGGFMMTGVNATEVDGIPAFGIQPTGGHFTAGNLTLRVRNSTGQPLQQLAVAYTIGVINDRDRSNTMRLYWSATNTPGSYVAVPSAEVVSPTLLDDPAQWIVQQVQVSINGFSVPSGQDLFLRWVGDDIEGSGQRDEFALAMISLQPQALGATLLSSSVNVLSDFSQTLGAPSEPQSFTVSGSGLSNDVLVSVAPPYEVSVNASSGFGNTLELSPVSGTLNSAVVHVRLNATGSGTMTGEVQLSCPGTNGLQVLLAGVSVDTGLPNLFINEVQAANSGAPLDENGEADDWFEIYNPSDLPVDLAGWYVTDDATQLNKYRFSTSGTDAVVPANGWLLVWADNQSIQGNLHTNFALSSTSGEAVLLVGPDAVSIVDQITFGPQAEGVSFGREVDGGTPWVTFSTPTPGASNNIAGSVEHFARPALHAWPSPATDVLYLDQRVTASVHDVHGRLVATVRNGTTLDVSALHAGAYFLRTANGTSLRFMKD